MTAVVPGGGEGLVTRNPRASMRSMSAAVREVRLPGSMNSLNGSFGVGLLLGGLGKWAGLLMDQSATFVAPPSIEKKVSGAGGGAPKNRRLPEGLKRTKSSAETYVMPWGLTWGRNGPVPRPKACPISCRKADIRRGPGGILVPMPT